MNRSAEILLKLVRIALGNETNMTLPADVNWQEVIDLSFEQGVAAIAVDGLQKVYETNPGMELVIDSPELEDLKYEWFGETFSVESDNENHLDTLRKLIGLFKSNGVRRMLLFKGLSLAPYYPIPSHRPCGDIDIHLFDDYELGNKIIESQGIKINRENKKHSTFSLSGILVENHRTFLNIDATNAEKRSNKIITAISEDCIWDEKLGCYTFSPIANYLFLLRHIVKHFSVNNTTVTLRHLLDWGLFLNSVRDILDVKKGNELMKELGLTQVKEIFTRISMFVTGCDLSFALEYEYTSNELNDVETRFLNDIITQQPAMPTGVLSRTVAIIKMWFGQIWKFKYIPDSFTTSVSLRFVRLAIYKFAVFLKGGKLVSSADRS